MTWINASILNASDSSEKDLEKNIERCFFLLMTYNLPYLCLFYSKLFGMNMQVFNRGVILTRKYDF